jgi:hypothetical protein
MRDFTIGDYQIGRIALLPTLVYAYPILGAKDEVQAIVIAAQSLNWLTVALAKVEFPSGAVLTVTDRNGTVLARLPDVGDLVGQTLPETEVATLSTKGGRSLRNRRRSRAKRLWAHAL